MFMPPKKKLTDDSQSLGGMSATVVQKMPIARFMTHPPLFSPHRWAVAGRRGLRLFACQKPPEANC